MGESLRRRFNRGQRSDLGLRRDNVGTEIEGGGVEDRAGPHVIGTDAGQAFRGDRLLDRQRFHQHTGSGARDGGLPCGGDVRCERAGVVERLRQDL